MNHAGREVLGRVYILDDAKFPSQLLASVLSRLLTFKVNFSLNGIRKYTNGCFIGDTCCKTSVVHEYRTDKFTTKISYGVSRFIQKVFFSTGHVIL